MHTLVVANPRSGSGKAGRLADAAAAALTQAGLNPLRVDVGPGLDAAPLRSALPTARAVVVAGGDGTVRSVASDLDPDGPPVYHLPSGNENLFSRQFGHGRNLDHLVRTIRAGGRRLIDAGRCRWVPGKGGPAARPESFYLMVSVGPDAGVCHRLDARRTRATGHWAYTRPTLDEWASPTIPSITITTGGRRVVDRQRGMVVIANTRQYALRIDPCPDAEPTDGLLDLAFIPADTAVDVLAALARLRLRTAPLGMVRVLGERFSVVISGAPLAQADGESVARPTQDTCVGGVLDVWVEPRRVPVCSR